MQPSHQDPTLRIARRIIAGHELWWKPGEAGRGFVQPTGEVHTWPESLGSHRQLARLKGLPFNEVADSSFQMRPDGTTFFPYANSNKGKEFEQQMMQQAAQASSRLKPVPYDPRQGIAQAYGKTAEQRGWTDMYHVSPRANRESIQNLGLMGDSSTSPWGDQHLRNDQPHGNYMFDNPQDAENYAWMLGTRTRGDHEGEDPRHDDPDRRWKFPEPPSDFHTWPTDQQDEWHDNSEPVESTDDPYGYDVWKVNTRNLPIHRDPESALGQEDPPTAQSLHRDYKGGDYPSTHELYGGPWQQQMAENMRTYGQTPRRYYTPEQIEPQRMQLHQHMPVWNMDNESALYDDPETTEQESPASWDEMQLRRPQFPAHSSVHEADYYHVAPAEERDRIQQHGLYPQVPDYAPHQAEGVYAWPDEVSGEVPNSDVWRIPSDQVQRTMNDPMMQGAVSIPHHVFPELHRPDQGEASWYQQEKPNGTWRKDLYDGQIPDVWNPGYQNPEQIMNSWGIGRPNQVWGNVHEADAGTTFNPIALEQIEPQRVQLQQHIPSWNMTEEEMYDRMDDPETTEQESPLSWDEMQLRRPQFPAHSRTQWDESVL